MNDLEMMLKLKGARDATWELKRQKEIEAYQEKVLFTLFTLNSILWLGVYFK